MSARVHIAAVAVLGLLSLTGLALWDRWGTRIWLADAALWCG